MEMTPLPTKSIPVSAVRNGGSDGEGEAVEETRHVGDQWDQENLHMTIDMLNQKMDEQLSSFDAKAMKSLKRSVLLSWSWLWGCTPPHSLGCSPTNWPARSWLDGARCVI
jgi:hypothetical protein